MIWLKNWLFGIKQQSLTLLLSHEAIVSIMITFSERGVAFTFFAVGLRSGLLIFIVATIQ